MNRVEDAATPCLWNQGAGSSAADVADHVDVIDSDHPEPEASVGIPEEALHVVVQGLVVGKGDEIDPLRTYGIDDRSERRGNPHWERYSGEGVGDDVRFPFDVTNVTCVLGDPCKLEGLTHGVGLRLLAEGGDEAVVVRV